MIGFVLPLALRAPTPRTFPLEMASSPTSSALPDPNGGVGATVQLVPFQCSASVTPSVDPIAHTSPDATPSTSMSSSLDPGLAMGATLQVDPSQGSARAAGPARPTDPPSLGPRATIPLRTLS